MCLFSKLFHREATPPDRTTDILNKHLTGDFRVFPLAERKCTITEIREIEKEVAVTFSPEMIAHLCGQFPGIYIEAREEIWPRPKAYDVAPFWSFLYAIHTYTAVSKSDDWMRLDYAATEFQKKTGIVAAPVLSIKGDANVYCVDANSKIVRFDHELNTVEPVDLGYFELLDREVSELCNRTERKKKHG